MSFLSMTAGFFIDNGFRLGDAMRRARSFEQNKKDIVRNLQAYQEQIGSSYVVSSSTSDIFGEKISIISLFMKDRVLSITLFEDSTPMLIKVETLGELRSLDFYFGDTLKEMLAKVTKAEKIDAETASKQVKDLLRAFVTTYKFLSVEQLAKAELKVANAISQSSAVQSGLVKDLFNPSWR